MSVNESTVKWRQCVEYKAALHFANTKSHNTSSVMRALWGRMKTPPWLKILSTRAEVAGTQYIELTKWRGDLNCHCRGCSWQWHLVMKTPIRDMTAHYNAQVPYTAGLKTFRTTEGSVGPSRPRPCLSIPRPWPHNIGLECSRDQDHGLEDYIPGNILAPKASCLLSQVQYCLLEHLNRWQTMMKV